MRTTQLRRDRLRLLRSWITGGILALLFTAGCLPNGGRVRAQGLPMFDFTHDVAGWVPAHDVDAIKGTREGLNLGITGGDPYIIGPPRDYPVGQPLWLHIKLKSSQGGSGQVFYFETNPTEEDSVRFPVPAGVWYETRVPMPALGPGYRIRIDPPGTGGDVTIASLSFEPRVLFEEPKWPRPPKLTANFDSVDVTSGALVLSHNLNRIGEFEIRVNGQKMAIGLTNPRLAYLQGGAVRWLNMAERAQVSTRKEGRGLRVIARVRDDDGATWQIVQRFSPARQTGAIDVEVRVSVDQSRSILFLPMIMLLPGVDSFKGSKGQGLFAGLEYLEDEASSSERDITGPAHRREVPNNLKVTFPLMAIQANDRYLGLIWDRDPNLSALFDSPDRIFHAGGHAMGVIFPGSDGNNRVEGNLLPYDAKTISPGQPLVLHATIIGGKGDSVVPAVQQYVAIRGLPPVPPPGMDRQAFVAQAAAGWLDSQIREGSQFRHALPGRFEPHPTADAAVLMDWLADQTTDHGLAERLSSTATEAIGQVAPADFNFANVSHVTYPVASLVYGHTLENARKAGAAARGALGRFEPDNTVLYHPTPGGTDLGKTHFAPDANGLTGQVVVAMLDEAAITGDRALIGQALEKLQALDKFMNGVPRGAQTWEVPLHTPDILASAYMVRAYTLGYELTGSAHYLEQAKYWAWTGVPFVYLVNSAAGPVGPYATIAVYGATQWVAPVWMGLPVQWCGLVYSDALYRLMRQDPAGPWKQIADGITVSGIQQSWPKGSDPERQGLLPDSFALATQSRNDPAINPGTVLTNAIRYYGGPELYDFRSFRQAGVLVHAPGAITNLQESATGVSFRVEGWPARSYEVLIGGLKAAPEVMVNSHPVALTDSNTWDPTTGLLVLRLEGKPTVDVRVGPVR